MFSAVFYSAGRSISHTPHLSSAAGLSLDTRAAATVAVTAADAAAAAAAAAADPAAEAFAYPVSIDIRDLIGLEDVMEELQLGPNG
jgi:hypothetical protein